MSKRSPLIDDFKDFADAHPYLRFFQCLAAFLGTSEITVNGDDPYYWEDSAIRDLSKMSDLRDGERQHHKLRARVSEILVRNDLGTDQRAIDELIEFFRDEYIRKVGHALSKEAK